MRMNGRCPKLFFATTLISVMGCDSLDSDPKINLRVEETTMPHVEKGWRSLGGPPGDNGGVFISSDEKRLAIVSKDGIANIVDASPYKIELHDIAPDRPSTTSGGQRAEAAHYANNILLKCIQNNITKHGSQSHDKEDEACRRDLWNNSGTLQIQAGNNVYVIDAVQDRIFISNSTESERKK